MECLIFLKDLTWNNQRNVCKSCKSKGNEEKTRNCSMCRKIRLMKMSEKIVKSKSKKNYWTCQRCKKKFNQIGKTNFLVQNFTAR